MNLKFTIEARDEHGHVIIDKTVIETSGDVSVIPGMYVAANAVAGVINEKLDKWTFDQKEMQESQG
jgi:hypothetical protein